MRIVNVIRSGVSWTGSKAYVALQCRGIQCSEQAESHNADCLVAHIFSLFRSSLYLPHHISKSEINNKLKV